eukprot:1141555-Pelagomonas_calceolata.AAC.2
MPSNIPACAPLFPMRANEHIGRRARNKHHDWYRGALKHYDRTNFSAYRREQQIALRRDEACRACCILGHFDVYQIFVSYVGMLLAMKMVPRVTFIGKAIPGEGPSCILKGNKP